MKAETIAETFANSLGHVHCKALLYTMAPTVAEHAYMLAWKKEKTHAATTEVMWRLTYCSRRWLTG